MRHPRKEGHYHAQGHSAGKKDPWREGLVRDYTCFRFFELQDLYSSRLPTSIQISHKEGFDLGKNFALATYALPGVLGPYWV